MEGNGLKNNVGGSSQTEVLTGLDLPKAHKTEGSSGFLQDLAAIPRNLRIALALLGVGAVGCGVAEVGGLNEEKPADVASENNENMPEFGETIIQMDHKGISIIGNCEKATTVFVEVLDANGDKVMLETSIIGVGSFRIELKFPDGVIGGKVIIRDPKGKGFTIPIEEPTEFPGLPRGS